MNDTVTCRFCGSADGEVVLDMGHQPACDHFPAPGETVDETAGAASDGVGGPVDPVFPVRMWLCGRCALAQLAEDPTVPDEARAVEPQALLDQAARAVEDVAAAGLLPAGGRVVEYGSPHGGSWLELLAARGLHEPAPGEAADVVLDTFGLMHDADQAAALRERAARLAPGGTLLVQYHSLAAVLRHGQWNQVRHGHPAYLSTPALVGMLAEVGLTAVGAWWFGLYGGTVLIAARPDPTRPDPAGATAGVSLRGILDEEHAVGVTDPGRLRELQADSTRSADGLRDWLGTARAQGRRVVGYGAASRAVPLLNRAGIGPDLLECVADASPAKQGRLMPGVRVPIVAPDVLADPGPDPVDVLVLVPDLLAETRARFPAVAAGGGRWVVAEPAIRVASPTDAHPEDPPHGDLPHGDPSHGDLPPEDAAGREERDDRR